MEMKAFCRSLSLKINITMEWAPALLHSYGYVPTFLTFVGYLSVCQYTLAISFLPFIKLWMYFLPFIKFCMYSVKFQWFITQFTYLVNIERRIEVSAIYIQITQPVKATSGHFLYHLRHFYLTCIHRSKEIDHLWPSCFQGPERVLGLRQSVLLDKGKWLIITNFLYASLLHTFRKVHLNMLKDKH